MNSKETRQDPRYLRAKQATEMIMATHDKPLKRCLWLFLGALVLHLAGKWTLVPALLLALFTGQLFFVKALVLAGALCFFGGVAVMHLYARLNRMMQRCGIPLMLADTAPASDPPEQR